MTLREFKTREELQELLDRETEDERRELPDNNLLENAIKLALGPEYTATELQVFGYPRSNSQYLFFVEYSGLQPPLIHVRKPLTGHDLALLDESIPLILEQTKHHISKHGKILSVGDVIVCDVFHRHLSAFDGSRWNIIINNECGLFYMTATQREALMKENTDAPSGFSFEPVDVDRDGDTIHTMWKYSITPEITKTSLRVLPSICARNDRGEMVGWAMTQRLGMISNLFLMPEYRGRGVGRDLELSHAKEFVRRELRVFKYVETCNTSVYGGSLRSPLWTLWTSDDEDNNETKKPNPTYYRMFERV
ncbi:hypothetical protein PENTCL1PPCAC_21027 [Pristionchus entomophagus]|uniref:GCN5-related N-acetyltransferase Rv2170-like domain-containing protein n=1 Tax=Pristionchus entomophagus TaxID=358040 RepID=A0AAV5TXM3_9BILA|nr:hypothetical protein PENTCL1PPCAC_21027 [Pristionchus entomophagus]